MKIQGLAIIFIIIILPMSIILAVYTQSQIKTLDMQVTYDSKLINATYDGIKAFQLNSQTKMTANLTDSRIQDIEASAVTFFNSLASNFNMAGYGKKVLQNYVPAVVYTLYDGYYIYSPYTNTLDKDDKFKNDATYKNNATINGLKPYIYYSCRYQHGNDYDFVITYTLDNYITIEGKVNGEIVNKSGYLLSGIEEIEKGSKYKYKGIEISKEKNLSEKLRYEGVTYHNIPYQKINGVKYYKENVRGKEKVFYVLNNKREEVNSIKVENENDQAVKFYEAAYNFTNWVSTNLNKIQRNDAVGLDKVNKDYKIFEIENIEDSKSDFNRHRLEVIKHSIESNLSVAISNYNKISDASVNFQMPKLKDAEWEKVLNNVTMITFLQGLNIGGKVYSGHAIVENDKTEEFVSEDSIYILGNSGKTYYKVTDNTIDFENAVGIFSVNTQRKSIPIGEDNSIVEYDYFYPINALGSYNSIVYDNTKNHEDISEYVKKSNDTLKKLYYTALARERYSMYRVNNPFLENN